MCCEADHAAAHHLETFQWENAMLYAEAVSLPPFVSLWPNQEAGASLITADVTFDGAHFVADSKHKL